MYTFSYEYNGYKITKVRAIILVKISCSVVTTPKISVTALSYFISLSFNVVIVAR